MAEIKKTVEVKVRKCDFCENEDDGEGYAIHQCSVCGKDICEPHCLGDVVGNDGKLEDGQLCPDCDKKYYFKYVDGCVGVKDRKTKQYVEAPYL